MTELANRAIEQFRDVVAPGKLRLLKGRIRLPNWQGPDPNNYRLGWDLRYTWHEPLPEGGERIMIATDRYMSFWELRNQPRTVDYPFTFLEIRFPKEGKGEGRMALANQIRFDF